jgi:hypothetical protein
MASRLTLLYGESGVGKSSVLNAGVIYRLKHLARENLLEQGTPEIAVVEFSAWRDEPIAGLLEQVEKAVRQAWEDYEVVLDPVPNALNFTDTLKFWAGQVGGELIIILDQFEEYFLYHNQEYEKGNFAWEFPRALNELGLRVSFLISLREDSLAKLDFFKGRIPGLFDNYLRLEHLNFDAARAAILKPIEQFNRLQEAGKPSVAIEPELVDIVLKQVKMG